LRAGPNPRGGLDRRSVAVALERAFEDAPVGVAVDEELRLAHRAAGAREGAHELVDPDPLVDRQRQPALLAVAVRRLGRPDGGRQLGWALRPPEPWKPVARKRILQEPGLGR